jgi:hypothetical protein
LIGVLALAGPAFAGCPLDAGALATAEQRGRERLFADDLAGYDAVWSALVADLPCAEAPLEAERFAALLYVRAVAAFASGADWQPPLDAALRANPALRRDFGPPELREWPVPAPAPPGAPLPADAAFRLDGRVVTSVPALGAWHVVQRVQAEAVDTRVVEDGEWPAEWRERAASEEAPRDAGPWLLVALGPALGVRDQSPTPPTAWVPASSVVGPAAQLAVTGGVGPLVWTSSALVQPGAAPALDGWLLVELPAPGPFALRAGGGATTTSVGTFAPRDGRPSASVVQDHSVALLPRLEARFDRDAVRAGLSGGASLAGFLVGADLGVGLGGPFVLWSSAQLLRLRFDAVGEPLSVRSGRATASVGVGWTGGR